VWKIKKIDMVLVVMSATAPRVAFGTVLIEMALETFFKNFSPK